MEESGCLASTPTFRAQFPWHQKCHQKGWPSGLCPNRLSCTVYDTTSGLVSDYGASWQHEDRNTCPSCWRHGPEPTRKPFDVFTMSLRYRQKFIFILLNTTTDASLRHPDPCLYSVFESVFESSRRWHSCCGYRPQPTSLGQTVSP